MLKKGKEKGEKGKEHSCVSEGQVKIKNAYNNVFKLRKKEREASLPFCLLWNSSEYAYDFGLGYILSSNISY